METTTETDQPSKQQDKPIHAYTKLISIPINSPIKYLQLFLMMLQFFTRYESPVVATKA
jgi:hypothetical protein